MTSQSFRFLVINVSRIGDTLFTTPAMRAIAAAHPGCRIDCLGHPNRAAVFEHIPFVHRVGAITKKSSPFRGWLGGKYYDVAFVYGFDEALVAYALRVAKQVVAFRQADETLNARLYRLVEPPPFQSEHAVPQLLRLPEAIGIPPAGMRLAYTVSPAETAWANQTLTRDIPSETSPLIGLQIASFPTKAYRDWPIDHFKALCDKVRQRWPQAHFLIFGGKDEHVQTSALKANLRSAATLYAGRLTLRQTVAIMSCTDLYIGVDTGPTHLMSTLDIPLIGLYHGFSPSRLIGPLEHPCAYPVDHPLADKGCSTEAPMSDITVERVWQAVERAFAEHPPRPR